jgi:uncharacterized protein
MKIYLFRCKGRRQLYGATRYETGSNLPTDQCIGGWELDEIVELTGPKLPKHNVDGNKLRRAVQQNGLYVFESKSAPIPVAAMAPPQPPAPVLEVPTGPPARLAPVAPPPPPPPPPPVVVEPPPVIVEPPPPPRVPVAPPPPPARPAATPSAPARYAAPPVRPAPVAAPPPRPAATPPAPARHAVAPSRREPVAAPPMRPATPPPAKPAHVPAPPPKPVPVGASPAMAPLLNPPAATPSGGQRAVTPAPPHQIVWFDIPVLDLERAVRFYSAVLGAPLEAVQAGFRTSMSLALLPHADGAITGCLVQTTDARPWDGGPLIYLNANGRLEEAVAAAEANGGSVVQPAHSIGSAGSRAIIIDSEGNRIALHSS